jgi:hypothetical protein
MIFYAAADALSRFAFPILSARNEPLSLSGSSHFLSLILDKPIIAGCPPFHDC